MGGQMEQPAVVADHQRGLSAAERQGAAGDGVEYRLRVRRRSGDDAKDLSGGRLLLQRLGQHAVLFLQDLACRLLPLQALRQALLQVADLAARVFGRLANRRSLGLHFSLLGPSPTIHPPLLASSHSERFATTGYANAAV